MWGIRKRASAKPVIRHLSLAELSQEIDNVWIPQLVEIHRILEETMARIKAEDPEFDYVGGPYAWRVKNSLERADVTGRANQAGNLKILSQDIQKLVDDNEERQAWHWYGHRIIF